MLNKLYAIINGLENMPRLGAEVDEPEGSRYIQISETLVNEMVGALKRPGLMALDKETIDSLVKNGIVYVDRMVIYTTQTSDSLMEAKVSNND